MSSLRTDKEKSNPDTDESNWEGSIHVETSNGDRYTVDILRITVMNDPEWTVPHETGRLGMSSKIWELQINVNDISSKN